jgi:hypothetical protein
VIMPASMQMHVTNTRGCSRYHRALDESNPVPS